jgi:hypothetical protein
MAVDFDQSYLGGHTCIYKFTSAITTHPFTFATHFESLPFVVRKHLINISPTDGGDHFSLDITGSAGQTIGRVEAVARQGLVNVDGALSADTFAFASGFNHAALTCSATHLTAYLNGVAGTPVPRTAFPNVDLLRFIVIAGWGTTESSTFGLKGCEAEPCGWNKVLSPEQIAALAGGINPALIDPADRVFHLRLLNEATAVHEEVNDEDWTLFEAPGSSGIATCAESPLIQLRHFHNRLVG